MTDMTHWQRRGEKTKMHGSGLGGWSGYTSLTKENRWRSSANQKGKKKEQ